MLIVDFLTEKKLPMWTALIVLFSDSYWQYLGGEVWRGGSRKKGYPPKGGLLPKCAVIFPAPAAFADGGCKTPTPLRQNSFPALWGWISVSAWLSARP